MKLGRTAVDGDWGLQLKNSINDHADPYNMSALPYSPSLFFISWTTPAVGYCLVLSSLATSRVDIGQVLDENRLPFARNKGEGKYVL